MKTIFVLSAQKVLLATVTLVMTLPLLASSQSAQSNRFISRRFATVGTIQEKDQSLAVVKDLTSDKTYYLREGSSIPGSRRFVVKNISNGKVSVLLPYFDQAVVLPTYVSRVKHSDISESVFRSLVNECRQDAVKFCDYREADPTNTLRCLMSKGREVSPGCAHVLDGFF